MEGQGTKGEERGKRLGSAKGRDGEVGEGGKTKETCLAFIHDLFKFIKAKHSEAKAFRKTTFQLFESFLGSFLYASALTF